ncbi:MAG TPA: AMP-binding protein [Nocardioidaceae bacterium]|nr:AMP-binding protein [Nocardioidaceae bacterium]
MPDATSGAAAAGPAGTGAASPTTRFRAARDYLLAHREDYATAYRDFRWPELEEFNWATDWFDVLATENGATTALWVVEEDGSDTKMSFAELRDLSQRLAGYLSAHGVGRGDRVLLLLGNCAPLWVAMLACIRMGAVMIPAATLLSPADLADRIDRGHVRAVVAAAADTGKFGADTESLVRLSVGAAAGWLSYDDGVADGVEPLVGGGTAADETLLLYFTSGTTAQPKLVQHTHASYPVGHLSTMYWIGVQPGDRHLNISSPGWAKHAWSCLFAPWNAGATIVVYNYARFDPAGLLDVLERVGVTTFCAPPTVWRMVAQAKLGGHRLALRECVGAGEPLNPEVIEVIQRAWGITIRDGYGQTETTAQVGNPPGAAPKLGSMGRPLPGYVVALVDPVSDEVGRDGEICLQLQPRPVGLMAGYRDDATREAAAMRGGFYHTGDVASMDDDGYVTYVGRADEVFKASDYRISPFELESVLIEHPAVAEAAVVPSPDPVRTSVPKAYVVLAAGHEPSKETAFTIMRYAREHLAPYKRIRRLEFAELPKTISGKIRRVELRADEAAQVASGTRPENAYTEEDFPDLKA